MPPDISIKSFLIFVQKLYKDRLNTLSTLIKSYENLNKKLQVKLTSSSLSDSDLFTLLSCLNVDAQNQFYYQFNQTLEKKLTVQTSPNKTLHVNDIFEMNAPNNDISFEKFKNALQFIFS